jgi:hypothetical protein
MEQETFTMNEYHDRMNWIMDKLDDDSTPDKIKLDIINFLDESDKVAPCKKCNSWFDKLMKLSKDM